MQLIHETRSGPGISVNNLPDISAKKAILPLKALFIDLFKSLKMIFTLFAGNYLVNFTKH